MPQSRWYDAWAIEEFLTEHVIHVHQMHLGVGWSNLVAASTSFLSFPSNHRTTFLSHTLKMMSFNFDTSF
jgi:hypothetical protein